jgi:hypothetical protein
MITLSRESFNNHTFKCEGDAFLGGGGQKETCACQSFGSLPKAAKVQSQCVRVTLLGIRSTSIAGSTH